MIGDLSSYGVAGSGVADQVALQIRRLTGSGFINVFDYMTAVQVEDVQARTRSLDVTSAIQAAIDAAYANNKHSVYLPNGAYKITSSLYLDPPGNLRSSTSNPPNTGQFSLALIGERGGQPSGENNHSKIYTATDDFVALWVGPGQSMYVGNIWIQSDVYTLSSQNSAGVGIQVAGGPGGATRTMLDQVSIANFKTGIKFGGNYNVLADSNTMVKCWVTQCTTGVQFAQTQTFLNSMYDCVVDYCRNAVVADVGAPVSIFGGNYSHVNAKSGFITVGSTSSISNPNGDGATDITFTTTVTSPPADLSNGSYNTVAFETANNGVVPCKILSFNTSTNVLTLQILQTWMSAYGLTRTLQSDIQAVTSAAAAEKVTIFKGGGFKVYTVHIENPYTASTLLEANTGFSNDNMCVLNNVFCNYDPSHGDQPGTAIYVVQSAIPFIESVNAEVQINSITLPSNDAVNIDLNTILRSVEINGIQNFSQPMFNVRRFPQYRFQGDASIPSWFVTTLRGGGVITDQRYTGPSKLNGYIGNKFSGWKGYGMGGPHHGYMPSPYILPRTNAAQIDKLTDGTFSQFNHDMLHGDAIYSVLDMTETARKYLFARNIGLGYTYGSDLSIPWTYVGGSCAVYLTGASAADNMAYIFPGLSVTLNNGSDTKYIVTGVNYTRKFFYVTRIDNDYSTFLAGTTGTTYTGSTIKQQPYNVKKYGRQCEFGSAAPSTGTWAVGDICWNTAPSEAGSTGSKYIVEKWICTVAGTPGTWLPCRVLTGN